MSLAPPPPLAGLSELSLIPFIRFQKASIFFMTSKQSLKMYLDRTLKKKKKRVISPERKMMTFGEQD